MEAKSKSIEKLSKPEATPAHSVAGIRQRAVASPQISGAFGVQSAAGNLAVQRLARQAAGSAPTPAAGVIQTKLAINKPGDEYEQEADRVSEQVMRMPEPQLQRACACGGGCPKCQTEQLGHGHESLQTKRVQASDTGQIAAPPIVHEVLRSPGQPLDPATRAFMEPRFGYDFSRVRVHSGAAAERSAGDVNAHAYTVGHDIVLGAGWFSPGTSDGRHLLAHELAHTIQQAHAGPRLMLKEDANLSTTAKAPEDPPWLSPSFKGTLPGVPVPGYETPRHTYTEADRNALLHALNNRNQENNHNVGYLLDVYVRAAVDICGRYATSEMSKAAKQAAGQALFGKLLDIALSVVLAEIVTFGVGVFAKPLSKGAVKALRFLAGKGVKFLGSREAHAYEQDVLSESLEKRQKALDQITQSLSKQVGEFTNDMVSNLGADVGNLGFWLGSARLEDLGRFRIPELFPHANEQAIRAIVAGAIAGQAHTHYASHGLLQEAYLTGPGEEFTPGSVHHMDDNIIIIHLTPKTRAANVRDVEFYSSSLVLSSELIGKAQIRSMPTVPLFIVVDAGATNDRSAAKTLMTTARFPSEPRSDEIDQFLNAYPRADRQMIIKRNNQGVITALGGGLAEQIWLYSWATGDDELRTLGPELITLRQEAELLQEGLPDSTQPQVSQEVYPQDLAAEAHKYLPLFSSDGAQKFIGQYVASLVPQAPEDRFKRAYWMKEGRYRFWQGHLPYAVDY